MSLERAFTMAEAAGVLRISRRSLQDLVKLHPHYYSNGKRKLFTESDIAALRDAMRAPQSFSARKPAKGQMWEELQRRLAEIREGQPARKGRRA
jgi:hypothetical protein